MASISVQLDDVDFHASPSVQTPADTTVTFSLGESGTLRLDLTDAHAKEFMALIQPWVDIATEVVEPVRTRRPRTTTTDTSDSNGRATVPGRDLTPSELKALRKWAFETDGEQPVHKYDGGGYRYDQEQIDRWKAARAAAKADDSK